MSTTRFYYTVFLLGSLMGGLSACNSVRTKMHIPDHTQDYQMQAVSVPPLVPPPGMALLKQDKRYQVTPSSPHPLGKSVAVSVIPPGSHL